jgi:mono/diheme cytochrome c family protein
VTRRILLAGLVGLLFATAALAQGAAPVVDLRSAQSVAEGQSLFNRRCAGKCHGLDGFSGENAPAVRDRSYLTPPFVYATITTGRPGSAMPSWKDRLSEEELWRVVSYVVSLQAP